jgi:hypothetical protein
MATNFPSSLDALTNPIGANTLASPDHAGQHADANDAIEALQTKVGVDSSAVVTSLDYKVAQKIDKTLVDAKGDLIVASAADTVGRLAVGATNGHVLTVDSAESLGMKWASTGSSRLTSDFTTTTISNTTAESNLLSYSLSGVAANQLYRITAFGTLLNNTGSNQNIQFRGKIGATTVFSMVTGQFAYTTQANSRKWRYTWDIFFTSTTAQDNSAFLAVSQANASSMPRIETNSTYVGYGASTEDFATAKNVIVSVEMGSASTSLTTTIEGYFIEKVS